MKKSLFILGTIFVVFAMVLSACGPQAVTEEAPAEEAAPAEEEAAASEEAAPAEETSSACPAVTVADMMGYESEFPGQFELADFEAMTGCEMTYTDNPLFADKDLPSVADRLPVEPLVYAPNEEIGLYGGTIRGISTGPESGNSGFISWRHASLVRVSDDMTTVKPNLAKAWDVNDNYTEFTFYLREGLRWSDGEPFSVDDMMFWFEDILMNQELNPDNQPPFTLEKIDDLTVKFTLAQPNYAFLIIAGTNMYDAPFQPKHFLSQFHINYNEDANALAEENGFADWVEQFRSWYSPWKSNVHHTEVPTMESHILVEETTEYRILQANPYYWKVDTTGQQLPYTDYVQETFINDPEVILLKVINGEVDLKGQALDLAMFPVLKENESAGNYTVHLPDAGMGKSMSYWLNVAIDDPVKSEVFNNPKFGQALSLSMDRDEINELIFLGLGKPIAGLPADPSSVTFVTEEQATYMTEFDLDQANALLDEIGMEMGADGFRTAPDGSDFMLYLEYCSQAGPPQIQELVKTYWEAAGIRVELKEVTTEVYRERVTSNDIEIGNWHPDSSTLPAITNNMANFYPPFAAGSFAEPGEWMEWLESDGAEGVEPPAVVIEQYTKAQQLKTMVPGSDEWTALGTELIDTYLDNMWSIGTVGFVPTPVITSNRLGNVADYKTFIWDYFWQYTYRVDQYFFTE
jgi:peptide/nickel transport system substrate-binding protein